MIISTKWLTSSIIQPGSSLKEMSNILIKLSCDNNTYHTNNLISIKKIWYSREFMKRSVPSNTRDHSYMVNLKDKPIVPVRLILSRVGSAQYCLAKWLAKTLELVLKLYSSHCVEDLLTFTKLIQNSTTLYNSFLCSFNISAL